MKQQIKLFPSKNTAFSLVRTLIAVSIAISPITGFAQKKVLSINEAIELGIKNSKTLQISQAKVNQAIERFNQAKEGKLPTAKASLMYNHAEILTNEFKLPGSDQAFPLPNRADAYIGSVAIQQLLFAGNKLKYASESTALLTQLAELDTDKNKEDLIYTIINASYGLYKIEQSQKVIAQNLLSINKQIEQAKQFFDQGIVTKNDVLRFQLQKNQIELTSIDLESNKDIVNFNLNILLGLPEQSDLEITIPESKTETAEDLNGFLAKAQSGRVEFKQAEIQSKLAETAVKNLKADYLPTIGVGANLYYINPTINPFPENHSLLAPASIAASISWNIDKLWTNKSKIAEAKSKKDEVEISRKLLADNIQSEINKDYQNYKKSLKKVNILKSTIEQAQENDRILESKYKNNIASATDRIDAETQLYQSLINLELAKADAGLAYYQLLKSTGNLGTN